MSDQRPVVRGTMDEADDEEGLGNGEPPEIKEFIEELGESGPEFIPRSTPFLLGLPFVVLLGCLTVSTAIWRDCASLFDLLLLNTPLGEESNPIGSFLYCMSYRDHYFGPSQENSLRSSPARFLHTRMCQT